MKSYCFLEISHLVSSIFKMVNGNYDQRLNVFIYPKMDYQLSVLNNRSDIAVNDIILDSDFNIDWKKLEPSLNLGLPNIIFIPNYLGTLSKIPNLKKLKKNFNIIIVNDLRHALPTTPVKSKEFDYCIQYIQTKNVSKLLLVPLSKELNYIDSNSVPEEESKLQSLYERYESSRAVLDDNSFILSELLYFIFDKDFVTKLSQLAFSRFHFYYIREPQERGISLLKKVAPNVKIEKHENGIFINIDTVELNLHKKIKDILNLLRHHKSFTFSNHDQVLNFDNFHPLLQSEAYTKSKSEVEKKELFYFKCSDSSNNLPIATVAVLVKKIGPFSILRINQGPVFTRNVTFFDSMLINHELKNHLAKIFTGFLIIKPNTSSSTFHIFKKIWPLHTSISSGYISGIIDLTNAESDILKSFTGTFRNRLNKCLEMKEVSVVFNNDKNSYEWIREKYVHNMKSKNFEGISLEMLDYLYERFPQSLLISQVLFNDSPISSVIMFLNGQTATYLIGFNSDQGRSHNVNNLQFWEIIRRLKLSNFKYLDLGGIDHINTPDISKFKERMNPHIYTTPKDIVIPLL